MRTQRYLFALSMLNLLLLAFLLLSRIGPAMASSRSDVLRGRAGDHRPEVKIGASVEGDGLSLVGRSDSTQLLLLADSSSSVRLKDPGGQERVIQP